MDLLAQPTGGRLLPEMLRAIAETLDAPDFAFEPVVVFGGFLSNRGLGGSAYALAVRCDEIYPPDGRFIAPEQRHGYGPRVDRPYPGRSGRRGRVEYLFSLSQYDQFVQAMFAA